jgi:hypothetical protein
MTKSAKSRKIMSPFMLALAAMAGWAAAHEPQQFSIASVGVWVCGAFTVALLTCAALALITPLLDILSMLFSRALKAARHDGAES